MEDHSQIILIPKTDPEIKLEYRRYFILFMYIIYGFLFHSFPIFSIYYSFTNALA